MKPAPFDWHAPDGIEAALALKARHGEEARFLAGGQSLVPAMNFRVAQPAVLIDLNRVRGLDAIEAAPDGGLRIGAMFRNARLERDPAARAWPVLAEALAEVAHPQIRNRGTLGGNLAHADPASEMPAVMLALDAVMLLRSAARGGREVPASAFFRGPLATALEPDEMLAEIRLPAPKPRTGLAFLELARRRGDNAMMGVAAVLTLDPGGICVLARITCCSAGPTPITTPRAAATLLGTRLEEADIAAAAELVRREVDPLGSMQAGAAYQRHLAGVLAARALRLAKARAA
jgi:carbon-monoxide dehydrogenase medium subunit